MLPHKKKLIILKYSPLEIIQLLSQTFFNIFKDKQDISNNNIRTPGILHFLIYKDNIISRLLFKILKNVLNKN